MRLTLLGLRLQGASDSKQLCSFRSRMPSCCYFQTLFSSEEQKRTRSISFRALVRLSTLNLLKITEVIGKVQHPLGVFSPSRVFSPVRFPSSCLKGFLLVLHHVRLSRGRSHESPKTGLYLKDLIPDRTGLSFSRPPTLLGFTAL